jgi:carboxymethylenebutenolidase
MKGLLTLLVGLLATACGPAEPGPDQPAGAGPDAEAQAAVAAHDNAAPPASPPGEQAPAAPVLEQALAYGEAEDSNLMGYLTMPGDAAEPLPAVILIHERWGLNDDIKAVARRLAAEQYVVLAVDLYEGRIAKEQAQAELLMSEVSSTPESARDNIRQAYEYLTRYALAPKVAVLGFDLGAEVSLQAALSLSGKLGAAVMYYGRIIDDADALDGLQTPLLGLFAENDEAVPVKQVQVLRSRLKSMGKNVDIFIYPGAAHAFADPGDANYAPEIAEDAWVKTIAFLDANLK